MKHQERVLPHGVQWFRWSGPGLQCPEEASGCPGRNGSPVPQSALQGPAFRVFALPGGAAQGSQQEEEEKQPEHPGPWLDHRLVRRKRSWCPLTESSAFPGPSSSVPLGPLKRFRTPPPCVGDWRLEGDDKSQMVGNPSNRKSGEGEGDQCECHIKNCCVL